MITFENAAFWGTIYDFFNFMATSSSIFEILNFHKINYFTNEVHNCRVSLNIKKRWKNLKNGYFSNLKIELWFSMFSKDFQKTNWIYWILSWQHQKNLLSDFIYDTIFRRYIFIENWVFFKKCSKTTIFEAFPKIQTWCNSVHCHIWNGSY